MYDALSDNWLEYHEGGHWKKANEDDMPEWVWDEVGESEGFRETIEARRFLAIWGEEHDGWHWYGKKGMFNGEELLLFYLLRPNDAQQSKYDKMYYYYKDGIWQEIVEVPFDPVADNIDPWL